MNKERKPPGDLTACTLLELDIQSNITQNTFYSPYSPC
jgi:hypothetical protein